MLLHKRTATWLHMSEEAAVAPHATTHGSHTHSARRHCRLTSTNADVGENRTDVTLAPPMSTSGASATTRPALAGSRSSSASRTLRWWAAARSWPARFSTGTARPRVRPPASAAAAAVAVGGGMMAGGTSWRGRRLSRDNIGGTAVASAPAPAPGPAAAVVDVVVDTADAPSVVTPPKKWRCAWKQNGVSTQSPHTQYTDTDTSETHA